MNRLAILSELLICISISTDCSRKQAQVAPNAPEVLVTAVQPRGMPTLIIHGDDDQIIPSAEFLAFIKS
jgi:pimeloyl-ACP methyl ester carboxylesterase